MQCGTKQLGVFLCVAALCGALVGRDLYPRRLHAGLAYSIGVGDSAGIKAALAKGADPNSVTTLADEEVAVPNQTMLTFAVMKCSPMMVKELLKAGADANQADPDGRTPLVTAINAHDVSIARILLSMGADPGKPGINRFDKSVMQTPMQAVAANALLNAPSPYERSVNRQSRVDVREIYSMLRARGIVPTLAQAVDLGDSTEVTSLIAEGADLNRGDSTHGSALSVAVDVGNRSLITRLLESGADVNYGDPTHRSALAVAVQLHDSDTVKLLAKHGADFRRLEKTTSIPGAAPMPIGADLSMLRVMRKNGAV